LVSLLARLLGPGGARGALQVVYFHQVLPEEDPLRPGDPTAQRFDALLAFLKSAFHVVDLADGLARLARGALPPAAVAISFDDGYADNVDVALPILRKHGLTATFFVATGFLGSGAMFNDLVIEGLRVAPGDTLDLGFLGLSDLPIVSDAQRHEAVQVVVRRLKYLPAQERAVQAERVAERCGLSAPPRLMTDAAGVRRLADAGMGVGAHTRTHPILAQLPLAEAERDIAGGRDDLAAILGEAPRLFAYPNGRLGDDYAAEHVALVQRLGFDAALTTNRGVCRRDSPRWELPRFTPWDRSPRRFALRLLQARRGWL
jgi:peptidoglycan/xylan/chitin deacetylase (PgdA/CDA1 family)